MTAPRAFPRRRTIAAWPTPDGYRVVCSDGSSWLWREAHHDDDTGRTTPAGWTQLAPALPSHGA